MKTRTQKEGQGIAMPSVKHETDRIPRELTRLKRAGQVTVVAATALAFMSIARVDAQPVGATAAKPAPAWSVNRQNFKPEWVSWPAYHEIPFFCDSYTVFSDRNALIVHRDIKVNVQPKSDGQKTEESYAKARQKSVPLGTPPDLSFASNDSLAKRLGYWALNIAVLGGVALALLGTLRMSKENEDGELFPNLKIFSDYLSALGKDLAARFSRPKH